MQLNKKKDVKPLQLVVIEDVITNLEVPAYHQVKRIQKIRDRSKNNCFEVTNDKGAFTPSVF